MICVQNAALLSRILVGARFQLARKVQLEHVIVTLTSHPCPELTFVCVPCLIKASLKNAWYKIW